MHFAFIPYGIKKAVDVLLRDMEAQKHKLIFRKEGKPDVPIWIEGQLRVLPFGIYEYVCPKENMDLVLNTLSAKNEKDPSATPYSIDGTKLVILRKVLKLESIPDYSRDKKLLWIRPDVSIIPIGIRKDGEVTEPEGTTYAGYTHEAI